jgi:UTP-glucose-1-phosphate uridylyltransferase
MTRCAGPPEARAAFRRSDVRMNSAPSRIALVVLAAGMGSRYGGLKQIDPVGPTGETVLDYSVFDARRAGFTKVVFVIRRDIEAAFRDQVGGRYERHLDVRYAFQEIDRLPAGRASRTERQKPWGTGHAVWCAAEALDEPFAVINADDYYGRDSYQQLRTFLSAMRPTAETAEACMVGFRLGNTLSEFGTVSRGLCSVGPDSQLLSVVEQPALEKFAGGARQAGAGEAGATFKSNEIVSMNCWGFTPAFLPLLERRLVAFLDRAPGPRDEFYLPAAVADLIRDGALRVRVVPTQSDWFGITYREDRPRVAAALSALVGTGVYPSPLETGFAALRSPAVL